MPPHQKLDKVRHYVSFARNDSDNTMPLMQPDLIDYVAWSIGFKDAVVPPPKWLREAAFSKILTSNFNKFARTSSFPY